MDEQPIQILAGQNINGVYDNTILITVIALSVLIIGAILLRMTFVPEPNYRYSA